MISYLEYINLLENKDILLYDFQKRISYFRLKKINKYKNQNGGGNNYLDKTIYNLEKNKLENMIIHLLHNNMYYVDLLLN